MYRLNLLGGAALDAGSGPLAGPVAQRRRLALLALLSAAPAGTVSRERIAALLFPEADEAQARHALSDAVHAVRKALGKDAILSVGEELRLNPELVASDTAAFEAALAGGDHAAAVALYRGPFLDGFFVSDAPEFERWADGERARLAGRYAQAVEALAEEAGRRGDARAEADWWGRLAAHDPYNARVALRRMRSLEAVGDRAGAIQHARLHAALLQQDIGADPDPEIVALADRLRSAPPVPAARGSEPLVAAPPPPATEAPTSAAVRVWPRRLGYAAILTAAVAAVAATTLPGLRNGTAAMSRRDPPIRAVAVLPLANLSGDPGQEYLADGLTDELITELARYRQLRVVSRSSVMRLKGTRRPVAEIARDLGVDALVEGTLLRDGDRVRVTAQLVRPRTGEELWAERYERDVRDVIGMQAQIALAIAREVHATTGARAGPPARPVDPIARELYMRGRYAASGRAGPALEQALGFLQQAIARDSAYAEAYAALADVYRILGLYGFRPLAEADATARALLDRALALDPQLPSALVLRAQFLADARQWEAALAEFRRASELDPSNMLAHHRLSMTLSSMGRVDEALAEARRAEALDPLSGQVVAHSGGLLERLGRDTEAIAYCRRAVTLDPQDPFPRQNCAMTYLRMNRLPEARAAMESASRLAPENPNVATAMALVEARSGDQRPARTLLREFERGRRPAPSPVYVAALYAALGDHDSAFRWLEREPWIGQSKTVLRTLPYLDTLRSDPRFGRVLQRLALPR